MIPLIDLANKIGAKLENVASENLPITGIAPLKSANQDTISFFSNRRYRDELKNSKAAAIILKDSDKVFCKQAMLVMDNPYLGYARAAQLFYPLLHTTGIHKTASVEADAKIGKNVFIGAGCVVESGVEIGDNCQLIANVTLCAGTRLGTGVIIHPGAVIGSDGFGNANDAGKWVKVPQLGGVLIADDVEIGANTTIDKGSLDDTIIGMGVKLDNQIQIGHNVQIGEHTAIAGCVGIAGSTNIGCYCMIAGGVGISGHLDLVDYVHVTAGSIVLQSITKPGVYSSGTPLETNRQWHRNYHRFKTIDQMAKRLNKLEL
jgi:UDP-3-O-[3-hydroxymyristoyl] glucosamine N-acyltransferase